MAKDFGLCNVNWHKIQKILFWGTYYSLELWIACRSEVPTRARTKKKSKLTKTKL